MLKIFLIVLIFIVIIIISFFVIFSDSKLIFWYLTNKKKFKYHVLRKYTKNNKDVLFLGTIHDMHFGFKEYGFEHLRAVLLNYQPDVLLIESREEERALGNLADGPIEMFYLGMIAIDLNIPVIGIDWFDPTKHKPGTTVSIRDENIFHNIDKAVKSYEKPLVVLGATHLLTGKKFLLNKDYNYCKLSEETKSSYFMTSDVQVKFHRDMIKYLEKRIERETLFLETNDLDEKWTQATESAIMNLNKFIEGINSGKYILDN